MQWWEDILAGREVFETGGVFHKLSPSLFYPRIMVGKDRAVV
jgi:hypothetical protein